MRLQAKLKLAFSKERKTIEIKYNTFEKATYDRFLCASIALRTKNRDEAYQYIDDITGDGSLNIHFKDLYDEASDFSDKELDAIMKSSMYPILKIDSSTWYDYFTELDISLYKNKIYAGDLGSYHTNFLAQLVGIKEEIIEKNIFSKPTDKKPQPYDVNFADNGVNVKIGSEYLPVDQGIFAQAVVNEINNIRSYRGKITKSPDGNGWQMLTNSALNNLNGSDNKIYYENGNHVRICDKYVKVTEIAEFAGIYFIKQTTNQYNGNHELCSFVIDFLLNNDELRSFRSNDVIAILENVDDLKKRDVVNYFLQRQDNKDYASFGLKLIRLGITVDWEKASLKAFLKYADTNRDLENIYKIDNTLGFEIKHILKIDIPLLNPEHRKMLNKYNSDLNAKRNHIKEIVGEITSSGLRERSKALKSDSDTQRFSKLCNKLIGHVDKKLNDADLTEVEAWLKDALELEELAKKIEKKLSAEKNNG